MISLHELIIFNTENHNFILEIIIMDENITCLATVKQKDGTIYPCSSNIKGNTYPLCCKHFKRRFKPSQLLCKQIGSSNFCRQIIKTGKNNGLYCSKNVFRDEICVTHLERYLGKCYFPECKNTSFYYSGLCSYHAYEQKKSSCPCGRHPLNSDNKNYYYCYQHKETRCDCLYNWENQNYYPSDIYFPTEVLLSIFDFGDCYFYSTIKCLSKYYNNYQYQSQLVSKYCFTKNLLQFDSRFKVKNECFYYSKRLFSLLINTYNLSSLENIDIEIYPDLNKLKFVSRHPEDTSISIVHIFRAHHCIILSKNKTEFIDILNSFYNIYLSNLLIIMRSPNYLKKKLLFSLKSISQRFNFFIETNFTSKDKYIHYNNLNNYLLRLLDNDFNNCTKISN